MRVCQVADPLEWDRWPEAAALLEPARERGGFAEVIEPDEALLVVIAGDDLLACATVWQSKEGFFEVKLVGGRDYRRWLHQLDEVIGDAARATGATELRAWGRRGWTKILRDMGWASFPLDHETNGYVKRL
jgi:hypothetical protein